MRRCDRAFRLCLGSPVVGDRVGLVVLDVAAARAAEDDVGRHVDQSGIGRRRGRRDGARAVDDDARESGASWRYAVWMTASYPASATATASSRTSKSRVETPCAPARDELAPEVAGSARDEDAHAQRRA